jgi:hypothetical protein
MISQMNQVQNAARLAMADHRAARVRASSQAPRSGWRARAIFMSTALVLAGALAYALPAAL